MKKIKTFRFDDLYESMPVIGVDEMIFFIGGANGQGQCVIDTMLTNHIFDSTNCRGEGSFSETISLGGQSISSFFYIPGSGEFHYFSSRPCTVKQILIGYDSGGKPIYNNRYIFRNLIDGLPSDSALYDMTITIPAKYQTIFESFFWK